MMGLAWLPRYCELRAEALFLMKALTEFLPNNELSRRVFRDRPFLDGLHKTELCGLSDAVKLVDQCASRPALEPKERLLCARAAVGAVDEMLERFGAAMERLAVAQTLAIPCELPKVGGLLDTQVCTVCSWALQRHGYYARKLFCSPKTWNLFTRGVEGFGPLLLPCAHGYLEVIASRAVPDDRAIILSDNAVTFCAYYPFQFTLERHGCEVHATIQGWYEVKKMHRGPLNLELQP